jgi:hypothetical protein
VDGGKHARTLNGDVTLAAIESTRGVAERRTGVPSLVSLRSAALSREWEVPMKWVLLTVGVLALIVAAMVIIGLLLPRDHVASTTTHINAPPDSVWRPLVEVSEYPRWRPGVRSVDVLSTEGALRWREHTGDGAIAFERSEEQRPRHLVTRIVDETLPFGGTWTYDLAPEADGTRLTITERGYVINPLFRFLSRFVFGHHRTQEEFLRGLGRRFGHDVTITRG